MSEEPGEEEPPSFEERLKAARSRQGLDAPPPSSAGNSGDLGGMSPLGDRPAGGDRAGLGSGGGGRHRLWPRPPVRHETHPDGGVRPAGWRGWNTQRLALVCATTDTGTKGPGRGTIVAAGGSIDALGQFQLHPALGRIGASVNFTQANLMMVVAGLLTFGLLWLGMRPRAMVPGRLQSAAEMAYEAVLGMCTETIGPEGRAYFPFVFTLFFFILFGNLLGVFP